MTVGAVSTVCLPYLSEVKVYIQIASRLWNGPRVYPKANFSYPRIYRHREDAVCPSLSYSVAKPQPWFHYIILSYLSCPSGALHRFRILLSVLFSFPFFFLLFRKWAHSNGLLFFLLQKQRSEVFETILERAEYQQLEVSSWRWAAGGEVVVIRREQIRRNNPAL